MKRVILKSTWSLGAAVLMGLGAQAQLLKVNIPFEFHATGKSMPAGDYIVMASEVSGIYTMNNAEAHASVIVKTARPIRAMANGPRKLVFNHGLDGYFLTEMWDGESGRSLYCPASRSSFVAGVRVIIPAK